jgi:serine/threonine protein kinase
LKRELGKGAFGTVRLCEHVKTKRLYAIKTMNKGALQRRKFGAHGRTAYDSIKEELKVLKQLEHPNLIWLHEIIDDPSIGGDIHLVTDYCSNGSLGDMLDSINAEYKEHNQQCRKESRYNDTLAKGVEIWQARFFFVDMLKAMHYCHRIVGVVHKDIKPDNIVIGHSREAILIDFGLAALWDHEEQD